VFSMMLHGISNRSRGSRYGYWACWTEVVVFLGCREHGACRAPGRVCTKVHAGTAVEVVLVLVVTGG
jgi:hypothetical protein